MARRSCSARRREAADREFTEAVQLLLPAPVLAHSLSAHHSGLPSSVPPVRVQLLWNMRSIFLVLGPDGMRLSGCRTPADIVRFAEMSAGGQRLIAAAGGGAASCSVLVSGVPSPPGMRNTHLTSIFVSSPMLLVILDCLVKHPANQADGIQKTLKQMRDDVDSAESASGTTPTPRDTSAPAAAAAARPAPHPGEAASSSMQVTAGGGGNAVPGPWVR